MLKECLENLEKISPRIHSITNYVTANDVANLLLACKAKPIMADAEQEVEEVTAVCSGLNLNLGTPNDQKVSAMLLAGKRANQLGLPVVFDPVGVGASVYRKQAAAKLMQEISFTAIRGNISEIKTLAFGNSNSYGVDAAVADAVTKENLEQVIPFLKVLCSRWNTVLVASGEIDLVCDGKQCFVIYNGNSAMQYVTGTGCQLSALLTALMAANPYTPLQAAATAVCLMGYAGEVAWKHMKAGDGNITYRGRIIDAIFNMTGEMLEEGARFELR